MNLAKRLIALAVVAVLLASSCIFVSAAMLTSKGGHNVTSDGAVVYKKFSAAGAHTEDATVLEFNPKNGYIPVAFDGAPTSVASIPTQYSTAVNTYGYEVAGVINAGYFTMSTSTLEGMVITDGKLVAATRGASTIVAFGNNGSMDIVTTQPKYTVGINGKSLENPIWFFNKEYKDAGSTERGAYMFYYDYSANAKTSYSESGTEVLFEKLDNSELSYGETLVGRVVSKKTSTTGSTTIAKNQFVLFAKNGSTYVNELNSLAVGNKVTINITETNAGAVTVMNNANSVLNNIDYLVKDGQNYTIGKTSVGGHNPTTTYARWTAYGVKADGTYVFLTTEGGSTGVSSRSLTLRNVADILIELGCVTAVRLDGGGSTGMYVSNTGSGNAGWVMTGQRSVADTILVVKKSSMHDATLETKLKSAIATAKQTAGSNAGILKAISEAEAMIGTNATEGQLRKAIISLSPKAMLGAALAKCDVLNIGEYTETDLAALRTVYDAAKAVYNSDSATDAQYSAQTTKVYSALDKSANVILSAGAAYTTTAPNRGDGHDDDKYRLTDGTKGGLDLSQYSYSGWNVNSLSNRTVNIDVDLGAVQSSNTFTVYMAAGMWGIGAPSATLSVYTSTDGVNYTSLVGTSTTRTSVGSAVVGSETCNTYTYTVKSNSNVSARYVRFAVKNSVNFTWIDEVEVSRTNGNASNVVTNYTKIQSFNTKITAGSSTIFTPDMGALTQSNANHTWSSNIICELQSDGSYVVVENVSWHADSNKTITLKSNQIMICAHSDPTVAGSAANASNLGAAQVGQVLKVYGIDLANKTISAAAYVQFENPAEPEPDYYLGDINNNGSFEAMDYNLLKRAYFGVYGLAIEAAGDLNGNGEIDAIDYAMLKRAYFGVYPLDWIN
ncbi:MAG: hypothetical protein E7586_03510 [Ruminococcaceae bacterium]|nr:hypothetical protein [Oscillospiraceae bacterium]